MIALVEVDICFERPPTVQDVVRVIAPGTSEVDCELAAIAIAEVTAPPWARIPVMAVGSRIVELLEL